jgi:hypothetical protein
MTAARFRSARAKHWRSGTLTGLTRHPLAGTRARFIAEVIDERTGNTRTLDTARHALDVDHAGHWLAVDEWADTTAPLFATEATR